MATSDAPVLDAVGTPDAAGDAPSDLASVDSGGDAASDVSPATDAAPDVSSATDTAPDVSSVTDAAPDVAADAVTNPDVPTVPAVSISTAGPLARATVGTAYTVMITAQGGVAPYSFSLPSLPPALAWLSIDGAGRLGGTPSQVTAATSFMVAVHDSRSATAADSIASVTYSLVVGACVEGTQVDCAGPLTGGGACGFGKSTCTNGAAGPCMATAPSTDFARCGGSCAACDATAAKTCTAGRCKCGTADACTTGACCANGTSASCVDTTTAIDNCGGCGVKCPAGGYHCDGACKCGSSGLCRTGDSCCGTGGSASCATLASDKNNCGTCGKVCDPTLSDSCTGSACKCGSAAQCTGSQTCCGSGGCATLSSDMNNCGTCGKVCDSAKSNSCSGGACKCGSGAQCTGSQTCCGGTCVDLTTSTNNCGVCGKQCPAQTNQCSAGNCACGAHVGACTGSTTCCGTGAGAGCYAVASTSLHCGSCAHSCLGDPCSNGLCQGNAVSPPDSDPYFAISPQESFDPLVVGSTSYTTTYTLNAQSVSVPAIKSYPTADASTEKVLCSFDAYSRVGDEVGTSGVEISPDGQYVYALIRSYSTGDVGLFGCPVNGGPTRVVYNSSGGMSPFTVGNTVAGLANNGIALYWGTVFASTGNTVTVHRYVF